MARFKLRPLFGRSKTASSSASEPESTTSHAAASSRTARSKTTNTTAGTSPSASQSTPSKKRSASSLQHKPSPPQQQTARSVSEHDLSTIHSRRTLAGPLTPPRLPEQPSSGTELSELSSVGEEDERIDAEKHEDEQPALILQQPTPPTLTRADSITQYTTKQPLADTTALTADVIPSRQSSNASPRHISRPHSTTDSANVPVTQPTMPKKIWVRRPGASATLVHVKEDDMVDDVRDMILRKYANSLGRTFDAPDMTLRIVSRQEHGAPRTERVLGVEEDICTLINLTYPGGQTVDEALVIDVPMRRTPKPSPKPVHHAQDYYALDDYRPVESGTDYFPPIGTIVNQALPTSVVKYPHCSRPVIHDGAKSMAVLTTGQLPSFPSPGSIRRPNDSRPKIKKQRTSSPTIAQHNAPVAMTPMLPNHNHLPHRPGPNRDRVDSSASESHHIANGAIPQAPNLPTPPAPEAPPTGKGSGSTPPTPSTISNINKAPRSSRKSKKTLDQMIKSRRPRRNSDDSPAKLSLPRSNLLDGSFPPINVLIVEDNLITLSVLQRFMGRLKVRWTSASNGKIALDKWRQGGFHLILMDIQMPIMNGLEATKEIRRLEKVNGIGVFGSSIPTSPEERRTNSVANGDQEADADAASKKDPAADKLSKTEGTFKSPIIIVALTASSLQSDRHEALAAGCNDFLTKPLDMAWLERKVKEWGCMQALIDFDGWKRWRDINEKEEAGKSDEQKRKEKEKADATARKMEILQQKQAERKKAEEEKKRVAAASNASSTSSATTLAAKRQSTDGLVPINGTNGRA